MNRDEIEDFLQAKDWKEYELRDMLVGGAVLPRLKTMEILKHKLLEYIVVACENSPAYQRHSSSPALSRRWLTSMLEQSSLSVHPTSRTITLSISGTDTVKPNIDGSHYSYIPILWDSGWQIKDTKSRLYKNPKFRQFEGVHFIQKGIERFVSDNQKYKFNIRVLYNGSSIGYHSTQKHLPFKL